MDEGEILDTTMIMLGIKRERGELGGTAGENAMLVNYIYENENSREQEKYFPILIAIHEQIHQIYRGTSHLTWVSESIAHYFATKAMLRVYPDNQAVREITEGLYNSESVNTPGLVEIQRRLDEIAILKIIRISMNKGQHFGITLIN
ncbi:MAG: hypothetical protein P8P98_00145 [Emcibacteraceae bacterium]|nr:hypothetical protein [Emcibacteraceae bacterium]